MNNENLKKALTEIDVILKEAIPNEEVKKLPKKLIDFIEENKNNNYNFKYNSSIELEEQNLLRETKIIIVMLYLNYWSNEDEKKDLIKILDDNEKKYIDEVNSKYSTEKLFKKDNTKQTENKTENNLPIEYHESIFNKIINFIKRIFFKKGR